MTDADLLTVISSIVLGTGLTVVTAVLGWHTRNLARATTRLGDIENRRDERENLRYRRTRLERRIEFAQRALGLDYSELQAYLQGAGSDAAGPDVSVIPSLYLYMDHGAGELEELMSNLVRAMDGVAMAAGLPSESARGFVAAFTSKIRPMLNGEIPKWRREVETITSQLGEDKT